MFAERRMAFRDEVHEIMSVSEASVRYRERSQRMRRLITGMTLLACGILFAACGRAPQKEGMYLKRAERLSDGEWHLFSGGRQQMEDEEGRIALAFDNLAEGLRISVQSESGSSRQSRKRRRKAFVQRQGWRSCPPLTMKRRSRCRMNRLTFKEE